jgi:DNA repair exonuclease SbcCD ATPase subunit
MERTHMLKPNILVAGILLALAVAPTSAQQRLFKCKDSKGKTYYTQTPPTECLGKEIDELSKQGRVVKKGEAAPTPEQIAAREAGEKRKKEEELAAKEEKRKNEALLNTYSSEKDIEDGRQRALKQADQATKEIEKHIAETQRRAKDLVEEKEFYAKKPMPKKLQDDIKNNESDLKGQQEALAAKKKDLGEINAKYDEYKRRYLELTAVAKPKAADAPAGAASPKK